ncbi:shikimate kinase [Streptomyces phaeofaciens]|uniref:shikimate kinase n=1 Tax=Streptomyces phaeofaciens TaxID=68254 RepID=UPI00367AF034
MTIPAPPPLPGRAEDAAAPLMVLIGPAGAGKTTLGREVAARAGVPFVDLDAVGDRYYAEVGWSVARVRERIDAVGRLAAETEWEPARAHAVARVVADRPGAVVALGAGHTSYTDPAALATARAALARCRDVVRLLPSPDRTVSLAVLRRRCAETRGSAWIVDGHDFLAQWLDDPAVRRMATRTVHTGEEPPGRTAERLLRGGHGAAQPG